jgi:hypothetical protein
MVVTKMNDTIKVYDGFIVMIPIENDEEENRYREILKNYKMKGTCKVQKSYEVYGTFTNKRFLKFTFFIATDAILFKLTYAGKTGILL